MTIEDTARSLVGVRWMHQGRDPAVGLDCAGLGAWVLGQHGYNIQDRADYGKNPNGSLTAEITRNLGAPVGKPIRPNDIVTMQFAPNKPRHVGIIGSHPHGLTLIHACNTGKKRVVEILLDDRWLAYIVDVWRPTA